MNIRRFASKERGHSEKRHEERESRDDASREFAFGDAGLVNFLPGEKGVYCPQLENYRRYILLFVCIRKFVKEGERARTSLLPAAHPHFNDFDLTSALESRAWVSRKRERGIGSNSLKDQKASSGSRNPTRLSLYINCRDFGYIFLIQLFLSQYRMCANYNISFYSNINKRSGEIWDIKQN